MGERLNGGDKVREATLFLLLGQFKEHREKTISQKKEKYELVVKKTIPLNKLRMVFLIQPLLKNL